MADTAIGLDLSGGYIPQIPANASLHDLINELNHVIDGLNQQGGVEVKSGTVAVEISAAPQNCTAVPHGLLFSPGIEAYLNNVSVGFVSSKTIDLPLPTFLDASLSGGTIGFSAFMFCMADETNLYFYTLNATGSDLGTFDVTFYLKRQLANQTTE